MLLRNKSKVQHRLNDLQKFSHNFEMSINTGKTKIQPFKFSKKFDFVPEMQFEGKTLEVVYKTQLLGVTITSDCSWNSHINEIVTNANQKMWFIRRLKKLGASKHTLVDIYKLFVRQSLELAAPLWACALTRKN